MSFVSERKCEVCGSSLEGRRADATVCSNTCYESRRSRRRVEEKKGKRNPNCAWCGKPIPNSRRSDAVTCSIECNLARCKDRTKEERRKGRQTACVECGEKISEHEDIRTLYCSDKCRKAKKFRYDSEWRRRNPDKMYTYHKSWSIRNPDVVSAHRHKRRALMANAFVEEVIDSEVFEEWEWLCGICGGFIDEELKWPHPGSATIDHILPISKGGKHEFNNVCPAHYGCNSRKRDRVGFTTPPQWWP